jgi:hypothetical protein
LSAVCLAEDISHALSSDKEVKLLVDKILHGGLEDVVSYLCDILIGDDIAAAHEVSTMSDDVSVTGKPLQNDNVTDATHSKFTESIKTSKRLSTMPEYDRAFKRMNNSDDSQEYGRNQLKTDAQEHGRDALSDKQEDSGHVFSGCPKGDKKPLHDRPINQSKDISEFSNSTTTSCCNCLSQTVPSNELWSVSRGSSRVSCCHSRSTSTKIETRQQEYCHLNRFRSSVKTCEGKSKTAFYGSTLRAGN